MTSLTDRIRVILDQEDPNPSDKVTHEGSFDIESAAFESGGHRRTAQVAVILAGPPSMGMSSMIAEILARHPELVDVPVVLTEQDVALLGEHNPMFRDFDGDHPALIERICRDQMVAAEAHRQGMVLVLEDDLRSSMAERSVECLAPCAEPTLTKHRDWEGRDPCRNKHLRRGGGRQGGRQGGKKGRRR